jgi:hypothetical protein
LNISRRVAICVPEHVQPRVAAYQMRCAECPTRVWVSVLLLDEVGNDDGIEPLCVYCAREALLRNDITPIMSISANQLRYFAEHGGLSDAYDAVSRMNESRSAMIRYLDELTWLAGR